MNGKIEWYFVLGMSRNESKKTVRMTGERLEMKMVDITQCDRPTLSIVIIHNLYARYTQNMQEAI